MRKLSMEDLQRDSVEDFKNKQKNPLVLVLDNVRSLHNVGSAFRTADAFAVEKIYLCGITGTPPNKEIHKTALGATESVEWIHVPSTLEAVEGLKSSGYQVWAVEQAEGSTSLADFSPWAEGKYAFVFGNEVFGVEDEVIKAADGVLEIPQFGTKHSLNISVTVGVVVWDVLSKTLAQKPQS
ncbi:RNA methyltransferase [Rufibacter aurantiacus]|uniref:RNA methyltransferase n=1 Tax=Rufibacter aurantiacus TaxID=2817374 RepID=UPI001B30F2D5|nr:RNA methyltransferase [Rufibacter aurantiacus]